MGSSHSGILVRHVCIYVPLRGISLLLLLRSYLYTAVHSLVTRSCNIFFVIQKKKCHHARLYEYVIESKTTTVVHLGVRELQLTTAGFAFEGKRSVRLSIETRSIEVKAASRQREVHVK